MEVYEYKERLEGVTYFYSKPLDVLFIQDNLSKEEREKIVREMEEELEKVQEEIEREYRGLV